MSSAFFYKWRAKFGGMDVSMMTRMKELEDENKRLKKEVYQSPDASGYHQGSHVRNPLKHLCVARWLTGPLNPRQFLFVRLVLAFQ
jgi:hypothetical protein